MAIYWGKRTRYQYAFHLIKDTTGPEGTITTTFCGKILHAAPVKSTPLSNDHICVECENMARRLGYLPEQVRSRAIVAQQRQQAQAVEAQVQETGVQLEQVLVDHRNTYGSWR